MLCEQSNIDLERTRTRPALQALGTAGKAATSGSIASVQL